MFIAAAAFAAIGPLSGRLAPSRADTKGLTLGRICDCKQSHENQSFSHTCPICFDLHIRSGSHSQACFVFCLCKTIEAASSQNKLCSGQGQSPQTVSQDPSFRGTGQDYKSHHRSRCTKSVFDASTVSKNIPWPFLAVLLPILRGWSDCYIRPSFL